MDKYTISQDMFNPNQTILFDGLTGQAIGYVIKEKESQFKAIIAGKKDMFAIFSKPELARGYIGSCVYGREVRKKDNSTKQLSLF